MQFSPRPGEKDNAELAELHVIMIQNERQILVTHLSTNHYSISYNVILYCCTKCTDEMRSFQLLALTSSHGV
jgi:hypothetical protein